MSGGKYVYCIRIVKFNRNKGRKKNLLKNNNEACIFLLRYKELKDTLEIFFSKTGTILVSRRYLNRFIENLLREDLNLH